MTVPAWWLRQSCESVLAHAGNELSGCHPLLSSDSFCLNQSVGCPCELELCSASRQM